METKIKLKSGAMLEMTMLDFEKGLDLLGTVSKELLSVKLDLGNIDIKDIHNSELGKDFLDTIKNSVLTLVISKELREGLNEAFGRCTYNNEKVSNDVFEKNRADYFVVCWEVLRFNLSPFLPKTDFLSLINLGKLTGTPKPK